MFYYNIPVLVFKKVGLTPKECINEQKKSRGVNYFHLGNLDPMAEGLLVLIPFAFRFLEGFLKNFKKEYYFSVLQGISTDSHDLLGLIINYDVNCSRITDKNFKEIIEKIKKQRLQSPPKISYKNLNTQNKRINFLNGINLPNLPNKKVCIYSFDYIGHKVVHKNRLMSYIRANFRPLKNDFRQKEIFEKYKSLYTKFPENFIIYDFRVKVSSGFYIRSLVR
ncbi:hypothetical protein COV24_03255, partial [candidate division WWE3 bacterium CG10_big_fil_rev_8_21_14_0_10_32_10]